MQTRDKTQEIVRSDLAMRLFFKLYQCANLLHKTGTKAVESEGLTTQQWAVLGALSSSRGEQGMSMGDLARYLMVSRQNLSGVVGRMERDGHIEVTTDTRDRRSRLIRMSVAGQKVWNDQALPKIHDYYASVLEGFSVTDQIHVTHYLIKLLANMERLDRGSEAEETEAD